VHAGGTKKVTAVWVVSVELVKRPICSHAAVGVPSWIKDFQLLGFAVRLSVAVYFLVLI